MIDATRVHRTQADFDDNIGILLRQGFRVQSNDGKRAVLFKEPGYGHPLLHVAMLFLFPIIGNIVVAWLARCGTGRSVAVELCPTKEKPTMTTKTTPETLEVRLADHTVRLFWDDEEECIKAAIHKHGTYDGIDGPTPLLRKQERQLRGLAEALP